MENSPEDSIRKFIVGQKPMEARYIKAAMARLLDIIEKDPEIDVSFASFSFSLIDASIWAFTCVVPLTDLCRAFLGTQREPW